VIFGTHDIEEAIRWAIGSPIMATATCQEATTMLMATRHD